MISKQMQQALDNCSKDPIHIPGSIQDFGAILGTDVACTVVTHASTNIAQIFDIDPSDVIGAPVTTLLTTQVRHDIVNVLGHPTIEHQRELLPTFQRGGVKYQLFLHRKGTQVIIELLPENGEQKTQALPLERAKAFMTQALDPDAPLNFVQAATERMRAILGMDRVKFYQFLADDSGEIVAESRHPEMPSFLGLRFPAEDIPQIARALYAKTPIRVVSDVTGADLSVMMANGADPLDMSLAVLRGKDKVHQQYLVNMGVASTLTIPVVVDGKLWGMFAAHHRQAMHPDPTIISAAELGGKLVSLRMQHAVEQRRQSIRISCAAAAKHLVVAEDSYLSTSSYWDESKTVLMHLLRADGVALIVDAEENFHGDVPQNAAMDALQSLIQETPSKVIACDNLAERVPDVDWTATGGALLITIPGPKRVQLFFFRNCIETKVQWAGRPEKEVYEKDNEMYLTPRKSFETYLQTAHNKCEEWVLDDLEIGTALSEAIIEAVVTQGEILENQHRMGLLVRELNHRVRNILALVQSISQQSREDATSVSAYAEAMENRVLALSGAHNLLTRSEMQGAALLELVEMITKPYDTGSGRVKLSGPNIVFRADATSILALLFHELASNAAKYGAFSVPSGRVDVAWALKDDGVQITWTEKDGPDVVEPAKVGFGQTIITGAVAYEFKGTATSSFLPQGYQGTFWLPGELIMEADIKTAVHKAPVKVDLVEAPVYVGATALKALVVEDNFIVASAAKRLLRTFGFDAVDAAATVDEALSLLSQGSYAFCLLDINLQGDLSTPVARKLTQEKIPFVFASGYGSEGHEIADAYTVPLLTKPIDVKELSQILKSILQNGS